MLRELKAAISAHGSLARTNRFKVDFSGLLQNKLNLATPQELRDLEYFLEDVNIPGKNIETIDYSLYRNPIAYATGYTNGEFSMKFRAPTNMFVKRIFDKWFDSICPRRDYLLSYRKDVSTDFTITQISERTRDNFEYYVVKILEAYPISITPLEYSNTQQDEYVSFNIDFAFRDVIYPQDISTPRSDVDFVIGNGTPL